MTPTQVQFTEALDDVHSTAASGNGGGGGGGAPVGTGGGGGVPLDRA